MEYPDAADTGIGSDTKKRPGDTTMEVQIVYLADLHLHHSFNLADVHSVTTILVAVRQSLPVFLQVNQGSFEIAG